MRDKPVPPAAPHHRPDPSAAADQQRRDRAIANLILRRAGIAPLSPVVALLMMFAPSDSRAQSAPVRATATARATILPASASLRQGQVIVTSAGIGTVHATVQPTFRPCDSSPHPTPATCRIIVYDLP